MTPRISAIITCRDLGATVEEALRSLERQTRPPAEIVVVDDGSTDVATRQVIARIVRDGTCVAHGPGRGASGARNLGARMTTGEYLVWLDADDTLEPGYFAAAGERLDTRPGLDFVSCAMRAFGDASYVWKPSEPTFVEAIATGGVPHASTVMRRSVWERLGGFDETLPSFELLDFWASALDRGVSGIVLDEPFINYRIRPHSGYRRSIRETTYLQRCAHLYAKHRDAMVRHGLPLLEAKEAFFISQRDYWKGLEARAAGLEAELRALREQIAEASRELEARGESRVNWGDLRRAAPFSRRGGRDRGTPIDRYYAVRFLDAHRDEGAHVVEVEDPAALAPLARGLDTGEVLLATFHGGRYTEASVRELFAGLFPPECFEVTVFGNVTAATAVLHGLSAEELSADDLDPVDPAFPVVIAVRAVKTEIPEVRLKSDATTDLPRVRLKSDATTDVSDATTAQGVASGFSRTSVVGSDFSRTSRGVILCYHRIAELTPDTHHLCLPPAAFREQMMQVREQFTPVALEDLVRAAASGRVPDRAIAITFDDGYLDALTTASPILAELGIPATFFVNTERLDEEHERWWDVLERVFLTAPALPSAIDIHLGGQTFHLPTATPADRSEALTTLSRHAWPLTADARRRLAGDVVEWSGAPAPPRTSHRVLTGDEIRVLASRPGHTVGAHTTHHLALTTQPAGTKRHEIADNKAALERLLGQPVHLFAYPYGDYDADTVSVVGDAGFRAAVTVESGPVAAGTNRLLLPRYEMTAERRDRFALFAREIAAGCAV